MTECTKCQELDREVKRLTHMMTMKDHFIKKIQKNTKEETIPKPAKIGRYTIRRVCANCTHFKRTEEEGFKHACEFDDTRKIMTGYCTSHAYTDAWENLRDLQMED